MKCNYIKGEISPNFKNTPSRIGPMSVKGFEDAIKYWEILRNAQYLDAHTDNYTNRMIRMENYSFLDKLFSTSDKLGFIRHFCEFTGFPNLRNVSENIVRTFRDTLNRIAFNDPACEILDSGFDPTCSVGLKKAFPGSDLDKGYVIIRGESCYRDDEELVNEVKGKLWYTMDSRIVGQNHPDTAIDVYTKRQIEDRLDMIEPAVTRLKYKPGWGTVISGILGPMFMGFGYANDVTTRLIKFHTIKHSTETDPYEAALFNRALARILPQSQREMVKNFAFFIETVEANIRRNPGRSLNDLFKRIMDSIFVKYSNVTQIEAWQQRINNGYLKTKLRNRQNLESEFSQMSVDTKYDLIKDVIKSSTGEQSSRFSQYFKNDDDIKDRYTRLLNSLK